MSPANHRPLGLTVAIATLALVGLGLFWWQGRAEVERGAPPPLVEEPGEPETARVERPRRERVKNTVTETSITSRKLEVRTDVQLKERPSEVGTVQLYSTRATDVR